MLERLLSKTKANKMHPKKKHTQHEPYLPQLNKCVSSCQKKKCNTTTASCFKKNFIHWLHTPADRQIHFDGQRTRLSCSSSASRDWQPDTEWQAVRLSLYPVIKSLPGICELLLTLLAVRCYRKEKKTKKNPSDTFLLHLVILPSSHTLPTPSPTPRPLFTFIY